jgi:hypothetical protein
MRRMLCFTVGVCASFGLAYGADSPFLGTWVLNRAKSHMEGARHTIKKVGPNAYSFINMYQTPVVITADGKEVKSPLNDLTYTLRSVGNNQWKETVKSESGVFMEYTLTLSADENTLKYHDQITDAKGKVEVSETAESRVGQGNGLAGTWELQSVISDSAPPDQMIIQPFEGSGGITFTSPADDEHEDLRFDGKWYPDSGPKVPKGSMDSLKRIDDYTWETRTKILGKLVDVQTWKLSPDKQTITLSTSPTNGSKPSTQIYERK